MGDSAKNIQPYVYCRLSELKHVALLTETKSGMFHFFFKLYFAFYLQNILNVDDLIDMINQECL